MEFASADQALRWAYNTQRSVVLKLSGIYRMRGPAATNNGVSVFERHAQSAQVTKLVDDLTPLERAYIHAKYARACSKEDSELLIKFGQRALKYRGKNRRGVTLLCLSYLGQRASWRAIRQEFGCAQNQVPVLKDAVFSAFDQLHDRVSEYLGRRLTRSGLIIDP